jgi:hypothetical protein
MGRTRFSKKSRRHTRRHTKRRTNKRRSRRVRKVGGADYSEEDMTLFKQHIVLNILNGDKKAKLLRKLSSMPYDPNYVYQFHIADAKKDPYLQGKDRIDAFNRYGDNWWGE